MNQNDKIQVRKILNEVKEQIILLHYASEQGGEFPTIDDLIEISILREKLKLINIICS